MEVNAIICKCNKECVTVLHYTYPLGAIRNSICMEHINMKRLKRRKFGTRDCLPSNIAVSTMKNGLYHATGFPQLFNAIKS